MDGVVAPNNSFQGAAWQRGLPQALCGFERMNLGSRRRFVLLAACIASGGCTRKSSGTPTSSAGDAGAEPAIVTSARFTTVRVDVRANHLELFLRDEKG